MKVALMTSIEASAGCFIRRWQSRLRDQGIDIGCVVIDENLTRRASPIRHALSVAKRQSTVARCPVPVALARLVVFRLWSGLGRPKDTVADGAIPQDVPCFRVSSLNSAEAVRAVRGSGADASCLLSGRILTRTTIQELGHLILNGHASDPRFVRGRPPVLWEVLYENREICLTVHQVVERLDAGPIYGQRLQEILYCGGIAATIAATMEQARVRMADLFAEVLLGIHTRTIAPVEFIPGPVRTIPGISELIRAEILCRRQSRRMRAASRTAGPQDDPAVPVPGPSQHT